MPRPKRPRRVCFRPDVTYFKPRGIPLRELAEARVLPEELEALKLHDVDGLDQKAAAKRMGVSQPTFGRVLKNAYHTIAIALIEGRAIALEI